MSNIIPLSFEVDCQLINVVNKGDMRYMADFPYGMALIASFLRDKGFKTLMLPYPIWDNKKYMANILKNPAYLYGFQVNCDNYTEIIKLVKIIKKSNPSGKVIYGGPFVVSLYEILLVNDRYVDAIVLGEGEYTSAELLKLLKEDNPDWKLINGLAWLDKNGQVIKNPHRQAIQDLDAMPFAARDGIINEYYDNEGKYLYDMRITTSRGCTSKCTFCTVNINYKLQKTKRWRGRDPVNVVDEIEELVKKYNVKLINLQDSAFDDPGTLGPLRNRIFCDEIIRRCLNISIKAYLRAESIKDDPESIKLYKLYKRAGIDVIIVGFESGSDYELRIYGKDASIEDNYRCFRVLQDLNLFCNFIGLIMFGPYTAIDTLRKNIKFLYDIHYSYYYYFLQNHLVVIPGSEIEIKLKEKGRLIQNNKFWKFPIYEFEDPRILKLVQHFKQLRKIFPHLDQVNIGLTGENIISRLKNKMNEKVAHECRGEITRFKTNFYKNKDQLNELGLKGFTECLDRIETNDSSTDLMRTSKIYFGEKFGGIIYQMREDYNKLVNIIRGRGFGLGGIAYDIQLNVGERATGTFEKY